jgi:thiamine biosynthesis lipoprotein
MKASMSASASMRGNGTKNPSRSSDPSSTNTSTSTLRRARPLLGTIVEVVVDTESGTLGHAAIDRAFETISVIQKRMSFHDPSSAVSRLNREADKRAVSVDDKTFRVLEIAQEFHEASEGVFDITIAPELEEAGFLPRKYALGSGRPAPVWPRRGVRSDVRYQTGAGRTLAVTADIELFPDRFVRFRRPDLRIDLGGIAKGFAVDEAVATLQAFGIESGLINAGGDLQVFGPRQFTVEIRDPSAPGKMVAALPLRNQAISTSAHYFADRISATALTGPFVDPRTRAMAAPVLAVTVIAPSAVFADALTKVVMINPTGCLPVLQRFDAAALMVDRKGAIFCTPNWYAKVDDAA